MRIITGRAKGRQLVTLAGEATRPTAEKAKEAIFSMLQFDIEGRRVLDLFAGSGQMGLEALSRGAASAVLVDSSREAVRVIEKNAAATKLSSDCKILCMDGLEYLKRESSPFDIVILDPPYASTHIKAALALLLTRNLLKPSSYVVCESGWEDIFEGNELLSSRFEVVKKSRYGIAHVHILAPILAEGE